jgi:glutamate synthase domain-containing protein 3
LEEIVGRLDLLAPRELAFPKGHVDLRAMLADPDPERTRPRRRQWARNDRPETERPLDEQIWLDCAEAVETATPIARGYEITNRERTVGARLAGEIARRHRHHGLPPGTIDLAFRGAAGQSFGAFCNIGMRLVLTGEAQDYVGKGMHGGEIVLMAPSESPFAGHSSVIVGNTVLYGATGGSLYAAGRAGERLGVRNSGARVVVEGCGDHGCEYMTGGVVVVLGETGRNFGAGMSGGVAYVLDLDGGFPERFNPGIVALERLADEIDLELPRAMIERHLELTRSKRAAWILDHWSVLVPRIWRVLPHPGMEEHSERDQNARSLRAEALRAVREEHRLDGATGAPQAETADAAEG